MSSLPSPRLPLPPSTIHAPSTAELLSPRRPRPRRAIKAKLGGVVCPPSIPVPDMAWGYEENDSGILTLQQPPQFPLGSSRGPGAYSPTAFNLPSAPNYDFSLSRGRGAAAPADDADGFDGDEATADARRNSQHEPPTWAPPVSQRCCGTRVGPVPIQPRQPMPIAANLQLAPRPPSTARPLGPQPPPPGPGTFGTPRGMGAVQQVVRTMPAQTRHYSRAGTRIALPLPPSHRGRHAASREWPGRGVALGAELNVKQAPLKSLPPLPAFVRHDIQFGGQTYYSTYDWAKHPWDDNGAFDDELGAALDSYGGKRQGDYPTTTRAPPTTADGESRAQNFERQLWRSFCAADESGDGRLSRKEFYAAIGALGALDGRGKEWAEKLKAADDDNSSFVEWPEFLALGKKNPELVDVMKDIVEWGASTRGPPPIGGGEGSTTGRAALQ